VGETGKEDWFIIAMNLLYHIYEERGHKKTHAHHKTNSPVSMGK